MSYQPILLAILLIHFILYYRVTLTAKVLGVSPEKIGLYDETKPFKCFDDSNVIPFSQINDDYCDCRDGSDEPGTAACLNGSFACENLDYIVQMIPSSRVNDGICDCCDGTDEKVGLCENKCISLAAEMRQEQEKLKHLRDQGAQKRKELIEQGVEIKKTMQTKLQELETKKNIIEPIKNELEGEKKLAEQQVKEAKEKEDKEFEDELKEKLSKEKALKARMLFEMLDSDGDSIIRPEDLLDHKDLDVLFNNDKEFTLDEAKKLLDDNEKVDIELFTNVYFEKISPHIIFNEKDVEINSSNEPEKKESKVKVYSEATQHLEDELNKIVKLYETKNDELLDVEKELKEVNDHLSLDTGFNNEFATMIDECYEIEDREYIYKLCPFSKTVQKSKATNSETIIGYWEGWNDGSPYGSSQSLKYSLMKFTKGLACWNGPQRSTNVHVSCGVENKLISVREPNKCEYEMNFETPAVCDEANFQDNQNETTRKPHEDL